MNFNTIVKIYPLLLYANTDYSIVGFSISVGTINFSIKTTPLNYN